MVRQITNAYGKRPVPPRGIAVRAQKAALQDVIEWRRVFGAFQLTIPVNSKALLLVAEERRLSVLLWIAKSIPHYNR